MATTKSNVKEAPSKTASKTTASKSTESKSTTAKSASSKSSSKSNPGRKTSSNSRSASSLTTTDHDQIKKWAEERGGKPSTVAGTGKKGEESGILRFDFPGYSGKDSLEEISWDEFFKKFDESDLQFLYQEKTSTGKQSRFNKFISKS